MIAEVDGDMEMAWDRWGIDRLVSVDKNSLARPATLTQQWIRRRPQALGDGPGGAGKRLQFSGPRPSVKSAGSKRSRVSICTLRRCAVSRCEAYSDSAQYPIRMERRRVPSLFRLAA